MDTASFLRHVLPSQGHYFLAVPFESGGYKHTVFSDIDKMAAEALRQSAAGSNVFFALANYEKEVYLGTDKKQHWRTNDNAVSARCFWIDIDCDKQYHGSQREGAEDLIRFCKETLLPLPNFVVNSGNGLHVYWIMDQDVPKASWKNVAITLKGIAQKLNFAQDDVTRTADVASVLRPIGCVNDKSHKGLAIKDVKLQRANIEPFKFGDFLKAIIRAKADFGVATRIEKPTVDINCDLGGGMEYPDASAVTIAQHCNQLAMFRQFKGGGQDEPTWRSCLGILKHCIEGDELAHEWSSGHESYNADDTQQKLDNWKTGPALCDTFKSQNAPGCAGCKHKCKTPMQLGQIAPEQTVEIQHIDEEEPSGVKIEPIPVLPESLKKKFGFSADRGLTAKVEDDEGVATFQTICTSLIIPSGYYRDRDDGDKWKLRLGIRTKPYTWIEAEIDARSIGQGGSVLMGELASHGMVTTRHPKLMEEYMKTWLEEMKDGNDEIAMHSHMGWQEDNSFVVGTTRYFGDGTSREVVLTEELRKSVAEKLNFTPVGKKERYCELIDLAYNRPDHEVYQFTYLAGYASPLISLLEPSPVGIVFSAWSSKSGFGKSTVAKLASGIWHDPTKVVEALGTTEYALYLNAGLRRNLPLVIDEITRWEPAKSGEFVYRYSSGMSKEQGAAAGGLRDNAHLNWSNCVICTGNKSQQDIIKTYNQECGAQLARVFEYEFMLGHDGTMSAEEGRPVIDELMRMRGLGGHEFSRYIATNRDAVTAMMRDTYTKLMKAAGLSKDARFWAIGCAAVWVAYTITKQIGLQTFTAAPLLKWIIDTLKMHDAGVKSAEVDYLALFGDAISVLHNGFIVTSDRGSRGTASRMAPGWTLPRGTITGRAIVDEGLLALSVTELTNWCRENRADRSQMVKELKRVGWFIKASNVRLGTGTHLPSPVVRVYELDWAKFSGRVRLVTPDGENEAVPTLSEAMA